MQPEDLCPIKCSASLAKSMHELAVTAELDATICSMALRIKFDLLSPIFFATAANFKSNSSGTFTVNVFIVFSNGKLYYQFVDMVIPGVIYVKILIWFSFMPGVYQFDRIQNSILHQISKFRITGISLHRYSGIRGLPPRPRENYAGPNDL